MTGMSMMAALASVAVAHMGVLRRRTGLNQADCVGLQKAAVVVLEDYAMKEVGEMATDGHLVFQSSQKENSTQQVRKVERHGHGDEVVRSEEACCVQVVWAKKASDMDMD